jgi:hypothetical protein
MLKEYNHDSVLYSRTSKLIERYDLHYVGGGSDKVYICTLQETMTPGGRTIYNAISYYGRRGSGLNRNLLGAFDELSTAHKAMAKQMKLKVSKGYKEVGYYVDSDAKSTANGALGSSVLKLIEERYPMGATIQSPTGTKAVIELVSTRGELLVLLETGEKKTLPFGTYGQMQVIS